MRLKRYILKNFKKVKKIYENVNYEYVFVLTDNGDNGIVFALAKENSGCESCVYGNIEHFNKVKKYI